MHHGPLGNPTAILSLRSGWHTHWRNHHTTIVGWGWLDGDPIACAEIAVNYCREFDLDGYIANGEDGIEGPNRWKSAPFVKRFRELAPHAPLALSYIGDGYPYRDLDFQPWLDAGACMMPQSYWGTSATSIVPSMNAAARRGISSRRVVPTLGTSAFSSYYDPHEYVRELALYGVPGFNIWLLDSTNDDTLRALTGR